MTPPATGSARREQLNNERGLIDCALHRAGCETQIIEQRIDPKGLEAPLCLILEQKRNDFVGETPGEEVGLLGKD